MRGTIGEQVMWPSVGSECSLRAPMEKIESAGIPNGDLDSAPLRSSAFGGMATTSPPENVTPAIADALRLV